MKIDTENYLTATQAAEALGASKRAVYRAMARATDDGQETFVTIFGRSLLPRDRLDVLKAYYYPCYSEAHQAKVKEWGAAGGATKAANRLAAGLPAKSPKVPKPPAPPTPDGIKRGRGRPRKYLRPEETSPDAGGESRTIVAGLPPPRIQMPDIALGSYEAAAITGTQWGRPARLAKAGKLIYRPLESVWSDDRRNEVFLYSLHDCIENYQDYIASTSNGRPPGKPRAEECLAQHSLMMKRLRDVEPILYDDAIGTAEAATILGVHITLVNRLIREGKIKARVPFNDRYPDRVGGNYIVSRRSAEENQAKYSALESAGKKTGTKRTPGKARVVSRPAPVRKKPHKRMS